LYGKKNLLEHKTNSKNNPNFIFDENPPEIHTFGQKNNYYNNYSQNSSRENNLPKIKIFKSKINPQKSSKVSQRNDPIINDHDKIKIKFPNDSLSFKF